MTGWTASSLVSNSGGAGTCSFSVAVTTPATTEFRATNGTNTVVGTLDQTSDSGTRVSCALYQDVAIPHGVKSATLSGTWGMKLIDGQPLNFFGLFSGLYPTSKVPFFDDAVIGGAARAYLTTASTTLAAFSQSFPNLASYAGTTVRLALFVAANHPTGSGVGGFDDIKLTFTYASAAIGVTMTQSAATPSPGTNVTYTITATNAGPDGATTVSLSDPLPTGMTFVSATAPSGWTATTPAVGANGTVSFTRATWATGGGSQTFTVVARVDPSTATGTTLTNTATISSDTTDPTPANNSAMTTATVGRQPQTITFAPLADQLITASPLTVAATASSGLAVAFASQTPSVCSVTGTSATLLTTGTCTIRASQAGDTTYEPAADVDRGFTVSSQAPPVVTSVAPTSGPAAGGQAITITGTGFRVGATVTIGGVPATNVTVVDATTLTATTPSHAGGAADVVVTNDDSQAATLSAAYTYSSLLRYYLAEGATLWTFDTALAIRNTSEVATTVNILFHTQDGTTATVSPTLAAHARVTLHAGDVDGLTNAEFGTVVESPDGVPLVVERTMSWDGGHAAHAETATAALSRTWYFAEGVQNAMDTYLLIANPGEQAADVTVTYLLETGAPVSEVVRVEPRRRATLWAGRLEALRGKVFSITVDATQPVVAERSVYFGSARAWDGGTCAMGTPAPSSTWYFAEGATGTTFDLYLLLANPGTDTTVATVTYLLPNGASVEKQYLLAGQSRVTVHVAAEDAQLVGTSLSTAIHADQPIVAEQAMYWSNANGGWREGHAGMGLSETGLSWGLADGAVGGANHTQTYLLLANPGSTAAEVQVTYQHADGESPVEKTYTISAASRLTVWVNGEIADHADETFSVVVTVANGVPIVVERSMYWDADGQWWAAGSRAPATRLNVMF